MRNKEIYTIPPNIDPFYRNPGADSGLPGVQ